jgi:hypothetical protein
MDSRQCLGCGSVFTPKSRRQYSCPVCTAAGNAGTVGSNPGRTVSSEEGTAEVGPTHFKFLLWPDTHFPCEDPKAVALGLRVLKYYQPDVIYFMGDMIDATGFGRFAHPLTDKSTFLQTELNDWRQFASRVNEICPRATKFYIEGNHEARVERWVWGHPQLTGLDEIDLNNLLHLDKLGFANNGKMAIKCELADGELIFTHGTHAGANKAGFAARTEMARFGTSGGSGHTHRLATYMERSQNRLRVWVEAGHMSQHQPHYMKTLPNWQQGLALGMAARHGNDFEIETVPFRLTYKCRIGGKEIGV